MSARSRIIVPAVCTGPSFVIATTATPHGKLVDVKEVRFEPDTENRTALVGT